MRADLARRHHVALGTVLGLAVGEAVALSSAVPPTICGNRSEFLPNWGAITDRALVAAESCTKSKALDIDLTSAEIAPAALYLAANKVSAPLLADSGAVAMIDRIATAMRRPQNDGFDLDGALGDPSTLATLRGAASFAPMVTALHGSGAPPDQLALAGALGGARWGPGAIPAAWVTSLAGPVGSYNYRLRQLTRLAERLLGEDAPQPPEPRRWVGPSEVAPKLWLSNMPAARRFAERHPDGAIVSLCPTTGALDSHTLRREFVLHDASASHANPHLSSQLDEVLATVDAFHDAGRDVLVHCHHGASRTGLVLRAWLMRDGDLSFDDATAEAQARWSKTSTWNHAFTRELRRREDCP